VLFALGTLIIFVGSLTLWVKRQALDTDAWVDTSSQLLENDEVRMALSVYIVDQLYANADPEAVLESGSDQPPGSPGRSPARFGSPPSRASTASRSVRASRPREDAPRGPPGADGRSRERDA
jgi:hypothetical protein